MLAKRIASISPSKTMCFAEKTKEMKRSGMDVIDFSVGEPDFNTPENICIEAKKAIDSGYTKYTVVNGIIELRKAICNKLQRENHVSYTEEQICVGTGAKQPLFNAVFAVCGEGDEVIIPTPSWVSYQEMVKLSGGVPVFVECLAENGFELDIAAIEKAITPNTRAIIINTPNNPTGAVYSKESLLDLGQLAVRHDFYIISDEVYEKLTFDGAEHISVASLSEEIKKKCILINGFSKSYAMTGWRIGYAAAETVVINAIKSIQSHTTSASNSITQYAAVAAYSESQKSVEDMHREFYNRRSRLLELIGQMPYIKACKTAGTFYIMLDISEVKGKSYDGVILESSDQIAELLLTESHVAIMAGNAFNADDYLRVCYAVSMRDIVEGMRRLETFVSRLK